MPRPSPRSSHPSTEPKATPPAFEDADNRRQRVRAAGLDPNHWYACELSSRLKRGKTMEVIFWGRSIAVYRGEDGTLGAMDNRCAHRGLKLSEGVVEGCMLRCQYHGWGYDADGKVCDIPHDTFGHKNPRFRVGKVPVQERYGLIFIFPGDLEHASRVTLPQIPELEGDEPWPHAFVRLDCPGHHSMLLDNVSDFTHGYLHRKYQPFDDGWKLLDLREEDDRVFVEYDSKIGAGFMQDLFVNRSKVDCNHMIACYDYPYHWSDTQGMIKHYLFVLPIDERTNRHIFIFYLNPEAIRIPGTTRRMPRKLQHVVLQLAEKTIMTPLLSQDVWALTLEQDAYETHWDQPVAELSPVVKAFEDLTIRKWSAYLGSRENTPLRRKSGEPVEV